MAAHSSANLAANLPTVQSLPAAEDFEAIEAAVMETARGRWFLAEYARRMRAAETAKLLEAVTRIERTLLAGEQERFQERLQDQHQDQPAALAGPEMGAAVAAIQERLSEIAWNLRERGFDERACAQIEAQSRALRNLAEAHGLDQADEVFTDAPSLPMADHEEAADMAPAVVLPLQGAPLLASLAAIDALEDRARARLFY